MSNYSALEGIAADVRKQAFDTENLLAFPEGTLLKAAVCYVVVAGSDEQRAKYPPGSPPATWPFMPRHWLPGDVDADLHEAACMIILEMERRYRALSLGRSGAATNGAIPSWREPSPVDLIQLYLDTHQLYHDAAEGSEEHQLRRAELRELERQMSEAELREMLGRLHP